MILDSRSETETIQCIINSASCIMHHKKHTAFSLPRTTIQIFSSFQERLPARPPQELNGSFLLPKHHPPIFNIQSKNGTRFLYYFCLCKSFKELFLRPRFLESGCKGTHFFRTGKTFRGKFSPFMQKKAHS